MNTSATLPKGDDSSKLGKSFSRVGSLLLPADCFSFWRVHDTSIFSADSCHLLFVHQMWLKLQPKQNNNPQKEPQKGEGQTRSPPKQFGEFAIKYRELYQPVPELVPHQDLQITPPPPRTGDQGGCPTETSSEKVAPGGFLWGMDRYPVPLVLDVCWMVCGLEISWETWEMMVGRCWYMLSRRWKSRPSSCWQLLKLK